LSAKQELQQKAITKAFSADEGQIAFHAKYLNIPTIDHATSATRTFEAVQTDYRQVAMDQPEIFLKTYDDEDLKLKYKIETAIESGYIALNIIPGKAVYSANKTEICDIPVGVDMKVVVDTLWMFSQTGKGVDFVKKIAELGG
jgi:hypothetical protein